MSRELAARNTFSIFLIHSNSTVLRHSTTIYPPLAQNCVTKLERQPAELKLSIFLATSEPICEIYQNS